jgi:bile acid:Na+ symporter, BASS family
MGVAELLRLAISTSILLLVFALGLGATFEQATSVLRRPSRLIPALLAIFVIVPAFAALLAWTLKLPAAVEIGMVAMAVSPVPPILPGKQLKFGGRADYVFGLLVAISLISVVAVPAVVQTLAWIFTLPVQISSVAVARLIATSVLAPLLIGMVAHVVAPSVASKVAPLAAKVGTALLLVGLLPVLVSVLPQMWQLAGRGGGLAITAVVAVGMAAGHVLGGSDAGERTPLAIASAMRHPGMALAIARLNFPDETLVPAVVLFFVLLAAIATSIYGGMVARRAKPA